jgi:hypothetical protein
VGVAWLAYAECVCEASCRFGSPMLPAPCRTERLLPSTSPPSEPALPLPAPRTERVLTPPPPYAESTTTDWSAPQSSMWELPATTIVAAGTRCSHTIRKGAPQAHASTTQHQAGFGHRWRVCSRWRHAAPHAALLCPLTLQPRSDGVDVRQRARAWLNGESDRTVTTERVQPPAVGARHEEAASAVLLDCCTGGRARTGLGVHVEGMDRGAADV